jgi:hypothetical protein
VEKSRSLQSLKGMDNTHQTVSGTTRFSTNVPSLSISKKERWVLQILSTKFHTEPAIEIESGVILNLVVRDIVINEHAENTYNPATKRKRRKRKKTEAKTEMIESIGENIAWLSTLEEEIAKLR